jgi:Rrf2 family protein
MIALMYISAKVDYAVRALCGLADSQHAMTAAALASSQNLPEKYLESILNDLRRANLVVSRRGSDGGYLLSRPASTIAVADVIRKMEGPLAEIRGLRPEEATYEGAAEGLQAVWVAVRASLRSVLEMTSIADIVSGRLPKSIRALTSDPESWISRPSR